MLLRYHVYKEKSCAFETSESLLECGYLICSIDARGNTYIIDLISPAVRNNAQRFPFLMDQVTCVSTIESTLSVGKYCFHKLFLISISFNTILYVNLNILQANLNIF